MMSMRIVRMGRCGFLSLLGDAWVWQSLTVSRIVLLFVVLVIDEMSFPMLYARANVQGNHRCAIWCSITVCVFIIYGCGIYIHAWSSYVYPWCIVWKIGRCVLIIECSYRNNFFICSWVKMVSYLHSFLQMQRWWYLVCVVFWWYYERGECFSCIPRDILIIVAHISAALTMASIPAVMFEPLASSCVALI